MVYKPIPGDLNLISFMFKWLNWESCLQTLHPPELPRGRQVCAEGQKEVPKDSAKLLSQ